MTTIIVLLAIFAFVCIVISGIVYSRQQAQAYREGQTKLFKQKYQEFDGLFKFILTLDDKPDIAIAINNELLDIAQTLVKLNKNEEEFLLLFDQLKTQAKSLKDGSLAPKAQKVVTSDTLMRTNKSSLVEVGQRLNRLKIRGKISPPAYEEYLHHLKKLTFDIEYESHKHLASQLEEGNDIPSAINHYKHAREALKKTRIEFAEKNEYIREITDKIHLLQKTGKKEKSADNQDKEKKADEQKPASPKANADQVSSKNT